MTKLEKQRTQRRFFVTWAALVAFSLTWPIGLWMTRSDGHPERVEAWITHSLNFSMAHTLFFPVAIGLFAAGAFRKETRQLLAELSPPIRAVLLLLLVLLQAIALYQSVWVSPLHGDWSAHDFADAAKREELYGLEAELRASSPEVACPSADASCGAVGDWCCDYRSFKEEVRGPGDWTEVFERANLNKLISTLHDWVFSAALFALVVYFAAVWAGRVTADELHKWTAVMGLVLAGFWIPSKAQAEYWQSFNTTSETGLILVVGILFLALGVLAITMYRDWVIEVVGAVSAGVIVAAVYGYFDSTFQSLLARFLDNVPLSLWYSLTLVLLALAILVVLDRLSK